MVVWLFWPWSSTLRTKKHLSLFSSKLNPLKNEAAAEDDSSTLSYNLDSHSAKTNRQVQSKLISSEIELICLRVWMICSWISGGRRAMLVVGCVLAIVVMLGLKGGGGLTERTRIIMINAVCRLLSFYNTGGNINNHWHPQKGPRLSKKWQTLTRSFLFGRFSTWGVPSKIDGVGLWTTCEMNV